MKFDKIDIGSDINYFRIREVSDSGVYHRRVITPSDDISSEVQEVKDKAEELWTDEVKTAWQNKQKEAEENLKVLRDKE